MEKYLSKFSAQKSPVFSSFHGKNNSYYFSLSSLVYLFFDRLLLFFLFIVFFFACDAVLSFHFYFSFNCFCFSEVKEQKIK